MRLRFFIAAGVDVVHLDGDVPAVIRIVGEIDDTRAARPTSLMITYLPIFSGKEARPFWAFARVVKRVLLKGNRALPGVVN